MWVPPQWGYSTHPRSEGESWSNILNRPPTDPTATGAYLVDWPGVCKHFGWERSKLCGPVIMGVNPQTAHRNCPAGHPEKCSAHEPPMVNGKPFALVDHRKQLVEAGLTTYREKLKAMQAKKGKPSGKPTKTGALTIYPAPHFG